MSLSEGQVDELFTNQNMTNMNVQNQLNMITNMLQAQQQRQQRPAGPKSVDMRGADRLDKFKGSVEQYPEWMAKHNA
jgi:hypothetical protein